MGSGLQAKKKLIAKTLLLSFILGLGGFGLFLFFFPSRPQSSVSSLRVPNQGEIQVLNGCGIPGAAKEIQFFLQDHGFDVLECKNADYWNFTETIVVSRKENMQIAKKIAEVLGTPNIILLTNKQIFFDATILVGKDYSHLIQREN